MNARTREKAIMKQLAAAIFGLLACALLLFGSGGSVSAAEVKVDLRAVNTTAFPTVRAYVRVLDQNREYVVGLQRHDFTLREDGVPTKEFRVTPLLESGEIMATALVIDRSGSMRGRPFAEAKRGAAAFLQLAGTAELVAVIDFGTNVRITKPLGRDKAQARVAISRIRLSGDTALYDAVHAACEQLGGQKAHRRAIVVLTDGRENRSRRGLEECLAAAAAGEIKIYTIGLGRAIDEGALRQMADRSGGLYYYSADPSNLLDIYRKISEELHSEYILIFTSELSEDRRWHRLGLGVVSQGQEGHAEKPFGASRTLEPPTARKTTPSALPPPSPPIWYYGAIGALGLVILFVIVLTLILARRGRRVSDLGSTRPPEEC